MYPGIFRTRDAFGGAGSVIWEQMSGEKTFDGAILPQSRYFLGLGAAFPDEVADLGHFGGSQKGVILSHFGPPKKVAI